VGVQYIANSIDLRSIIFIPKPLGGSLVWPLYISDNYGNTFKYIIDESDTVSDPRPMLLRQWSTVSISDDGNIIAATVDGSYYPGIYISYDAGSNFNYYPYPSTITMDGTVCVLNGAGTILKIIYVDPVPDGQNQFNQPQWNYINRVLEIRCSH
jgi:hypothetical protein